MRREQARRQLGLAGASARYRHSAPHSAPPNDLSANHRTADLTVIDHTFEGPAGGHAAPVTAAMIPRRGFVSGPSVTLPPQPSITQPRQCAGWARRRCPESFDDYRSPNIRL